MYSLYIYIEKNSFFFTKFQFFQLGRCFAKKRAAKRDNTRRRLPRLSLLYRTSTRSPGVHRQRPNRYRPSTWSPAVTLSGYRSNGIPLAFYTHPPHPGTHTIMYARVHRVLYVCVRRAPNRDVRRHTRGPSKISHSSPGGRRRSNYIVVTVYYPPTAPRGVGRHPSVPPRLRLRLSAARHRTKEKKQRSPRTSVPRYIPNLPWYIPMVRIIRERTPLCARAGTGRCEFRVETIREKFRTARNRDRIKVSPDRTPTTGCRAIVVVIVVVLFLHLSRSSFALYFSLSLSL